MTLKSGVAIIENYCQKLDNSPGVYRMINATDEVLYVGKAKQLKKRVLSYTKPDKLSGRIQRMIAQTTRMEFVITHTETEALLLEGNLIKELKPRYNIILRDDKSFPQILIRRDHPFPQVLKHRGARKIKGEYYGPYASTSAVNHSLVILERVFQLRNCSDSMFNQRRRPCLQYHIKRCTAPCVDKVTATDYAKQVSAAVEFLKGGSRQIQSQLEQQMLQAAEQQQYEKAGELRDRIRALTQLQQQQHINVNPMGSSDVVAMYRTGAVSCLEVFFYRDGQNYGNRAFYPNHDISDSDGDIMSAFLLQLYQELAPPAVVYLSHRASEQAMLAQALSLRYNRTIKLELPQKGIKHNITQYAITNAKMALERKLKERTATNELFQQLADLTQYHEKLERIEIYDNSHIQGKNPVGAMVVANRQGFDKKSYRLFNFADMAGGGDDIKMMQEMLTRRLTRAQTEGTALPDLMMIDGGKPQLSVSLKIIMELGLIGKFGVIAVAKGKERHKGKEILYIPEVISNQSAMVKIKIKEVALPLDDALQFFIQRLRDEAHRFAISAHRRKRKKAMTETSLNAIPGIGQKRKKALIQHFGSAQLVASAGIADLAKVTGISKEMAETIYDFYHQQ